MSQRYPSGPDGYSVASSGGRGFPKPQRRRLTLLQKLRIVVRTWGLLKAKDRPLLQRIREALTYLFTAFYVPWPADLVADFVPVAGWADDATLVTVVGSIAAFAISRYFRRLDERLNEEPQR